MHEAQRVSWFKHNRLKKNHRGHIAVNGMWETVGNGGKRWEMDILGVLLLLLLLCEAPLRDLNLVVNMTR